MSEEKKVLADEELENANGGLFVERLKAEEVVLNDSLATYGFAEMGISTNE